MSETAAQRQAMRLKLRACRAALDDTDQAAASMAVMARLARIPLLRNPGTIAGYRATQGELDIDAPLTLFLQAGATVTVPRVAGENLEFVPWDPDDPVSVGSFGIQEPVAMTVIPLSRHDVVLAPLVAFDGQGRRLGQGGGFYDRALSRLGARRPVIIGIAHALQQVDAVPPEPWDVPIDAVVTEDDVIEFRPGILDPGI